MLVTLDEFDPVKADCRFEARLSDKPTAVWKSPTATTSRRARPHFTVSRTLVRRRPLEIPAAASHRARCIRQP
jgi:hypothetical protein